MGTLILDNPKYGVITHYNVTKEELQEINILFVAQCNFAIYIGEDKETIILQRREGPTDYVIKHGIPNTYVMTPEGEPDLDIDKIIKTDRTRIIEETVINTMIV
jgi:hypothetical protein